VLRPVNVENSATNMVEAGESEFDGALTRGKLLGDILGRTLSHPSLNSFNTLHPG
jgi:hypothetical protein